MQASASETQRHHQSAIPHSFLLVWSIRRLHPVPMLTGSASTWAKTRSCTHDTAAAADRLHKHTRDSHEASHLAFQLAFALSAALLALALITAAVAPVWFVASGARAAVATAEPTTGLIPDLPANRYRQRSPVCDMKAGFRKNCFPAAPFPPHPPPPPHPHTPTPPPAPPTPNPTPPKLPHQPVPHTRQNPNNPQQPSPPPNTLPTTPPHPPVSKHEPMNSDDNTSRVRESCLIRHVLESRIAKACLTHTPT
jgi:hypothetical protein